MAKQKTTQESTQILKVTTGTIAFCLLGKTPLIHNRMSEKVWHELLMPRQKLTSVERAVNLKHNPLDEYRSSPYRQTADTSRPHLQVLSTAIKGAIRSAALDMPGAKKAQVGRLTYVEGTHVGVYGIPKLLMTPVRSADMNRTPDIRTRAIMPEWACRVEVTYVAPLMNPQAISNLLASAGITIGIGDWRQEKGSSNFGLFEIVSPDNATFKRIVRDGGYKAQVAAMTHPTCYDDDTTELLSWFNTELEQRRQRGGVSANVAKAGRARKSDAHTNGSAVAIN